MMSTARTVIHTLSAASSTAVQSMRMSIHMSVQMSTHNPMQIHIHLSVHISMHILMRMSVHMSIHMSTHMSIHSRLLPALQCNARIHAGTYAHSMRYTAHACTPQAPARTRCAREYSADMCRGSERWRHYKHVCTHVCAHVYTHVGRRRRQGGEGGRKPRGFKGRINHSAGVLQTTSTR